MTTLVLPCTCKHDFQDRHYGPGKRVHNFATKDSNWRCSVCAKTNRASKDEKKEEKK